jgi:pimeloyl-ACP methyl ester carboxylesterase
MLSAFRHSYRHVEGVHLHWAELGESSAHPPLVLIHGLTDSHLSWRKVAEEFARDRRVLMPDLPGCGLSSRPNASYELEWHARVIAHWLEQLGLTSLDVVGHSFGGGVAQMLLLECPERIRRMVLAASGGLGRRVGFWLKFATFPHFVEHYGQPFMAFGTRRAMGHLQDTSPAQDIEALSTMNAKRGTARAFSRTVRDVINFRGQTRHFLQRAHEVRVFPPIAVLWGERDPIIPIAHGRRFVERVNGAVFQTFPDCGHYLHQERPAEFVSAVRTFLDAPHAQAVTLRDIPDAARARSKALQKVREVLARGGLRARARE